MARRRFSLPVMTARLTPSMSASTLTSPNRTVISDAGGNWLATFTEGCRTVRVKGPTRSFVEQISFLGVQDDFARTRIDGWGNTVASGVWAVRTGLDSDFSVTPGFGRILLDSSDASRRIAPSSYGYDYEFADARVKCRADKLTRGPNGTEQQFSFMLGYTDISNHYLATLAYDVPWTLTDTFGVAVASGWGVEQSTEARTWVTAGGVAANYSVSGGKGHHALTALNSSRRTYVDLGREDGEVYTEVTFPSTTTGGSVFGSAMLRYSDLSNHLLAQIDCPHSSSTALSSLRLRAVVGGAFSDLAVTSLDAKILPNEAWAIRTRVVGTDLFARAWKVGTAEPSTWLAAASLVPITSGTSFGARSIASPDITSGTAGLQVDYDNFSATDMVVGDRTRVKLAKRTAGVATTITTVDLAYTRSANQVFNLRGYFGASGELMVKAWPDGGIEPAWQIETVDGDHGPGDVGIRSSLVGGFDLVGLGNVMHEYTAYSLDARWTNPPTITHDTWVYLLPTPFASWDTTTQAWLAKKLGSGEQDVLSFAMEYAPNAAPGYARVSDTLGPSPAISRIAGTQWIGDADYGPRDPAGNRVEGGDFNDYVGIAVPYVRSSGNTTVDAPEVVEFRAIDCSGLIRTTFGLRARMDMQRYGVEWTGRIPRVSLEINSDGPGILVFSGTVRPSAVELARMEIGDVVSFDAGVGVATEEEGEIDHNGIFMGVDINGELRFLSSRKTPNGPMFSDIGGDAVVSATRTNLYSRSLRTARRF